MTGGGPGSVQATGMSPVRCSSAAPSGLGLASPVALPDFPLPIANPLSVGCQHLMMTGVWRPLHPSLGQFLEPSRPRAPGGGVA